jgi:hypothetical protein
VRGRWLWGASGVVTAAIIAVPVVFLIGHAGGPGNAFRIGSPDGATRTFTVPQPVGVLDVNSDGALVRITAGAVSRITVAEGFARGQRPAGAPAESVSGGRLALDNTSCANGGCAAVFTITVPADVSVDVSTEGGPVSVAGVAGAKIDSGGGSVSASQIRGPLTASTEGGPLLVNGENGTLNASTGGGSLIATGVSAATAGIDTEGGPAIVSFAAAPRAASVQTGGGTARISVPGGPYALTADSGGGPESVEVPTSPSAPHSLTVVTGGGPLLIG